MNSIVKKYIKRVMRFNLWLAVMLIIVVIQQFNIPRTIDRLSVLCFVISLVFALISAIQIFDDDEFEKDGNEEGNDEKKDKTRKSV